MYKNVQRKNANMFSTDCTYVELQRTAALQQWFELIGGQGRKTTTVAIRNGLKQWTPEELAAMEEARRSSSCDLFTCYVLFPISCCATATEQVLIREPPEG